VKYLGAAYLVYLGIRKLVRRTEAEEAEIKVASPRRLFGEGFVVNVLNPKTAMFFLAFLPQFVDPARGPVAPQVLVLGAVWIALGMASDGSYALLASVLAGRLRSSARARRRLDQGSGVVYLGLGAVAVLATEGAKKL
jgi:threonine/homoserine/homoserine lactone efflux protein